MQSQLIVSQLDPVVRGFPGYPVRTLAWRVTSPLRAVVRRFRHLKGAGRIPRVLELILPDGLFSVVTAGGTIQLRYQEALGKVHLIAGFELAELRWALSLVKQGDVVFDVGAYVGWFTLPLAARVGATGLVVAVEPNAESVARLSQSLADNVRRQVRVVCAACWSQKGRLRLKVGCDPAFSAVGELRGSYPVEEREVPGLPLDALWEELGRPCVKLVKIDAEGAESEVLKGARRFITGVSPALLVKTSNPGRILELLPDGYAAVRKPGFEPWNHVFEREAEL